MSCVVRKYGISQKRPVAEAESKYQKVATTYNSPRKYVVCQKRPIVYQKRPIVEGEGNYKKNGNDI